MASHQDVMVQAIDSRYLLGDFLIGPLAAEILHRLAAAGWTLCPTTTAPRSFAQAESDGGGVLAAAAEGRGGER